MSDSPPYPDFVHAPDQEILDQSLTSIVRSLTNRNAQFLFGMGMSETSHIPDFPDVLRKLLFTYFPADSDQPLAEGRAEELLLEFPFECALDAFAGLPEMSRDDLTYRLKEVILGNTHKRSEAHDCFLSLFWGEKGTSRIATILTTNFDDLLEQTIGEDRAIRITSRNAKNIGREQQQGKIPVIHLVGALDEEYQATETDLFSQDLQLLFYELEVALHFYESFVFVGYSTADPVFRQIYTKYRSRIKNRAALNKRTYVVSPAKDLHSYVLGKSLWEKRGLIWFPLSPAAFFAKLKHFMMTRYDEEVKVKVMRKYNLAETKALDDYIHRTAGVLRVSEADALQFLHEALPRGGGK
jgi:hypothetical protein